MNIDLQYRFFVKTLFDAELRRSLELDPDGTLAEHLPATDDQGPFRGIHHAGLEADAQGRYRYLMSVLCRPYPLTTSAIGTTESGRGDLSRFLASEHMFRAPDARTAAFGDHLARLLDLDLHKWPPVVTDLVRSMLGMERALVDNAARIREAVVNGDTVAGLEVPDLTQVGQQALTLAPFTLVAELPQPIALLRVALGSPNVTNIWAHIQSGQASYERLLSTARGDSSPITFIARGIDARHTTEEVAVAGLAPLVDVRHRTVELAGKMGGWLRELQAPITIDELPASSHRLVISLAEAGMIVVADGAQFH